MVTTKNNKEKSSEALGKKKVIAIAVVSVVLIVLISSLIYFSPQFVGKAITTPLPTIDTLAVGQAGVIIGEGSTAAKGQTNVLLPVWANLGNRKAVLFKASVRYVIGDNVKLSTPSLVLNPNLGLTQIKEEVISFPNIPDRKAVEYIVALLPTGTNLPLTSLVNLGNWKFNVLEGATIGDTEIVTTILILDNYNGRIVDSGIQGNGIQSINLKIVDCSEDINCDTGQSCVAGVCRVVACPAGANCCEGTESIDLDNDVNNCGGCGKKCGNNAQCSGSACVCTGNNVLNTVGDCVQASCEGTLPANTRFVDTEESTDLTENVAITLIEAPVDDSSAKCEYVCNDWWANCDRSPTNGCEVELRTNSNCGECGHDCGTNSNCIEGDCVCDAGYVQDDDGNCAAAVVDTDGDGILDSADSCPGTKGTDGFTFADGYVQSNGCLSGDFATSSANLHQPDGCFNDVEIGVLNDIIGSYGECAPITYGIGSGSSDTDGDGILDRVDSCPGTKGTDGFTFADGYVQSNGCLSGDFASADDSHQPDGCFNDVEIGVLNDIIGSYGECTPR